MNINKLFLTLSLLAIAVPMNTHAGAFDQGSITATASIGNAQFFREDYIVLGIGAGYFVTDGVQVGLDIEYWADGDPTIYEVTPKISYIHHASPSFKPYLGAFYNRTYIDGFDDSDAVGYRAGAYFPTGGNLYFGIGVVRTELQDCTETVFNNCDETYTEFSLVFSL